MTRLTAPSQLPPAAPRTRVHNRQVEFNGYHRTDGLWDIEGTIIDRKAYLFTSRGGDVLPIGEPVHHMEIRATIDDTFTIRDIAVSMRSAPFAECAPAAPPMSVFVGQTMGSGWREKINRLVGGTVGCTHLRELLFNIATAAHQTINSYRDHLQKQRGEPAPIVDTPPPYMGRCKGWDFDGAVVQRIEPQFFGWKRAPKAKNGDSSV